MDEVAARRWLVENRDVPRETLERLDRFEALLREENRRQNLVSAASLDRLWARHIVDSAQLLPLAPQTGRWLDLGTGAGFPGLVVAMLWPGETILIEQRRLRADFLARAIEMLDIGARTRILCGNAGQLALPPADVISARAFAPLDRLFGLSLHLSHPETLWLLPKGRNAKTELEAARASWQGRFRLEPSCTDPEAFIIVAAGVRRRAGRRAK